MFQLRLHFVLKERIGIEEIGAEQPLTKWGEARAREQPRHVRIGRQPIRIDIGKRNLFCIRLHFVLEERIGVEKINAERLLTIDEAACHHVFCRQIFAAEIFGDKLSRSPQT